MHGLANRMLWRGNVVLMEGGIEIIFEIQYICSVLTRLKQGYGCCAGARPVYWAEVSSMLSEAGQLVPVSVDDFPHTSTKRHQCLTASVTSTLISIDTLKELRSTCPVLSNSVALCCLNRASTMLDTDRMLLLVQQSRYQAHKSFCIRLSS